MQEINNQIATTKANLDTEIGNIVSQQAPSSNAVQQGLLADKFKNEAAIAVAQSKKTALDQMDAQNNAIISSLPKKEQGFVRVKRDANVANEIYVMLAKRLEEAKVAEVMVPNEVQVVDAATLPENRLNRANSSSWSLPPSWAFSWAWAASWHSPCCTAKSVRQKMWKKNWGFLYWE